MKKILVIITCLFASVIFANAQNEAMVTGFKPMSQRPLAVPQPQHYPLQLRGNTAYGCWIYAGAGQQSTYNSFDVAAPSTVSNISTMSIYAGEYYNGNLYAYTSGTNSNFVVYNATTGAQISSTAATQYLQDMAYDYSTHTMYGIKGGVLYTVNLATGATTVVDSLSQSLMTLAIDVSGNMFGIASNSSDAVLYSVNKTTGACTAIGTGTGFPCQYVQSMGFDHNTGILYWCQCDASLERFCTVNTTTGVATAVLASGLGEVCGFNVPYVANQNLAHAPSNFTVTPDGNQGLSAVLSWTNPSTSLNGNALSSIIKVRILRDNVLIDSLTNATVGGQSTYTDTVSVAGSYNYTIYAVTSDGDGMSASASAIIGPMCTFNVEMVDAYGDGWNGASLSICKTDGTVVSTATLSTGTTGTLMVVAPIDTMVCVWVAGSYDAECSFSIKDHFNIPIYTSPASLSAGEVFRFYNGCVPYDTVVVSGAVTALAGNAPISNAVVKFAGAVSGVDTTDATGAYSISLLQGFSYEVSVVAVGFNDYSETAPYAVPSTATATHNISMTAPCISVTPAAVSGTCAYMGQATSTIYVNNCGNGPLTWTANALYDTTYASAMPQGITWEEFVARAGQMNPSQAALSVGKAPHATPIYIYKPIPSKNVSSNAICAISGTDLNHFTLNDPAHLTAFNVTAPEFTNSATYDGSTYYYSSSTSGNFGTINPTTGVMTQIATGNHSGAVAFNPADGKIYGMKLGANASVYTINATTGAETAVASCSSSDFLMSFAINNEGRFFVIDATADNISELNPITGALTEVWNCGFNINYGQDLDFDRQSDILYWTAYNATAGAAQLWAVDVNAGHGLLIGTLSSQTACFATETNTGWLTFQPAFGSTAANTIDTVTVLMNGWYAQSGTFHAVANFTSANPNVGDAHSNVTFTITAPSCDNPTNLQAQCVNHDYVALSWTAPANATNLTGYNIYRNGYHTPVATVTATSYEDHSTTLAGDYCYVVSAVYSDGCISSGSTAACATKTYCDDADMCDITVIMTSNNSSGWLDSYLNIYNGTRLEAQVAATEASTTYTFSTCKGTINFDFTLGTYDDAFGVETGIVIKDGYDLTVYSCDLGDTPQDFSFTNDCVNHTGIANHDTPSFGLYPNPANSVLNLTSHIAYNQVQILNYLGQVVYTDKVNDSNFQINVANLKCGLYFVRMSGENGTVTKKFIKK